MSASGRSRALGGSTPKEDEANQEGQSANNGIEGRVGPTWALEDEARCKKDSADHHRKR